MNLKIISDGAFDGGEETELNEVCCRITFNDDNHSI